jgi:hypothetical protein
VAREESWTAPPMVFHPMFSALPHSFAWVILCEEKMTCVFFGNFWKTFSV